MRTFITRVPAVGINAPKFPMDRLANVFCLAGALEESPQLFNSEISEIVKRITTKYNEHLWTEVFHLNLHGAARD